MNKYYLCYDSEKTKRIFEAIREGGNYPQEFGPYKVKYVRDLTTGFDNSYPDNKATLPTSSSSQFVRIRHRESAHLDYLYV